MTRPRPPLTDRGGRWRGARWRGRLRPPARCHPLVRALWAAMNREGWLLSEVAAVSGLSVATIKGWGRDKTPNVTSLEAAANALGYALRLVRIEETGDA